MLAYSKLFKITQISSVRLVHKLKLTMEEGKNAYIRSLDGDTEFSVAIKYTNPALGVDRVFNTKRQMAETLNVFLSRLASNITKVVEKKQKKKNPTENVKLDVQVINENGETLSRDFVCRNVFFNNTTKLKLKIDGTLFDVKINTPWVENITLPSSILSGFPVYPNKFEGYFLDRKQSVFTWFAKNADWNECARGFFYMPKSGDIGRKLKVRCEPRNGDEKGPPVEVESTCVVEAGPGYCPFESRHAFTKEKLSGNQFRVVSYNILADLYCDSDYSRTTLYPYCPPYALQIDYRKQLILKELIGYNSDIICLQEVDEKIFRSTLIPVLSEVNYNGCFNSKGATLSEGLTCLYNTTKFTLLDNHSIVFGTELEQNTIFSSLWTLVKTNKPFSDRILARSTTLQVTVLSSIDQPDQILVIGNTHLYFHPDSDHIRLFQGGLAITYLQHVIDEWKKREPEKKVSLIFCGDFNTVPECGIYKLYTTGSVDENHVDWSSNQEEALKGVSLNQPFKIQSACGTPKYTNFTAGFADCLDYIFYDSDHLSVSQVIPFPSENELQANTALPSVVFPSDHIALIADLSWK